MKAERSYPIAVISEKAEKSLKSGHVWVFGEEVKEIIGNAQDGELVDVVSRKGRFLGTGFFNSNSKIRVRILSKNANDKFDAAFFERRLRYCFEYRKTVMGADFDCCRLVFGEADSFPGLTVDRFGDILVTQTLSLGIEKRKNIIFPLMVKVLSDMGETITAVYERNDVAIREKEGLSESKGFFAADGLRSDLDGKTVITENGIRYNIDYINGQKTGFFLDQKYNRLAAGKIAKGKTVLDCFTHTGAFALNCAKMGAKHVTAVDISKDAVELTKENARLNSLSNVSFECANVFELLTKLYEEKNSPYDYIILDPPAFTKSSASLKNAERGYKEINMKAMKLLPRGGYLAT